MKEQKIDKSMHVSEEDIVAAVLEELRSENQDRFEQHVAICTYCTQKLQECKLLYEQLHLLKNEVVIPPLSPTLLALKQDIMEYQVQGVMKYQAQEGRLLHEEADISMSLNLLGSNKYSNKQQKEESVRHLSQQLVQTDSDLYSILLMQMKDITHVKKLANREKRSFSSQKKNSQKNKSRHSLSEKNPFSRKRSHS